MVAGDRSNSQTGAFEYTVEPEDVSIVTSAVTWCEARSMTGLSILIVASVGPHIPDEESSLDAVFSRTRPPSSPICPLVSVRLTVPPVTGKRIVRGDVLVIC